MLQRRLCAMCLSAAEKSQQSALAKRTSATSVTSWRSSWTMPFFCPVSEVVVVYISYLFHLLLIGVCVCERVCGHSVFLSCPVNVFVLGYLFYSLFIGVCVYGWVCGHCNPSYWWVSLYFHLFIFYLFTLFIFLCVPVSQWLCLRLVLLRFMICFSFDKQDSWGNDKKMWKNTTFLFSSFSSLTLYSYVYYFIFFWWVKLTKGSKNQTMRNVDAINKN